MNEGIEEFHTDDGTRHYVITLPCLLVDGPADGQRLDYPEDADPSNPAKQIVWFQKDTIYALSAAMIGESGVGVMSTRPFHEYDLDGTTPAGTMIYVYAGSK